MNPPMISFIVLSYNYAHVIGQCLDSILRQTHQDFELIIIDDASTDNSREVLETYSDPRIKIHFNAENLGGSSSFNLGLSMAKGSWIVNLDADDWITPDKLEKSLAYSKLYPERSIIGTWVMPVHMDGRVIEKSSPLWPILRESVDLNSGISWLAKNSLSRSSTMVRSEVYKTIGGSDPSMVRAPDYELWTRAYAAGFQFGVIQQPLTFQRFHMDSVTHGDPKGTFLEMSYAMIRNMGPIFLHRGKYDEWHQVVDWIRKSVHLESLSPSQSRRLIGAAISLPHFSNYQIFQEVLDAQNVQLETVGTYAMMSHSTSKFDVDAMIANLIAISEARDWWQRQALAWQNKDLKVLLVLLLGKITEIARNMAMGHTWLSRIFRIKKSG